MNNKEFKAAELKSGWYRVANQNNSEVIVAQYDDIYDLWLIDGMWNSLPAGWHIESAKERKMTKFTTINDAINHITDVMALDTDGAHWVYENSDCPRWNDKDFANYDFLADECVIDLPEEFVK